MPLLVLLVLPVLVLLVLLVFADPRWALFISMANECLATGAVWNQAAYTTKSFNEVELPFQTSTKIYPTAPETDAVATAAALMAKYAPV